MDRVKFTEQPLDSGGIGLVHKVVPMRAGGQALVQDQGRMIEPAGKIVFDQRHEEAMAVEAALQAMRKETAEFNKHLAIIAAAPTLERAQELVAAYNANRSLGVADPGWVRRSVSMASFNNTDYDIQVAEPEDKNVSGFSPRYLYLVPRSKL